MAFNLTALIAPARPESTRRLGKGEGDPHAAESGHPTAFVPGPKGSIIFGPFEKTEFYMNIGQGFHSNGFRGVTIKGRTDRPPAEAGAGDFPGTDAGRRYWHLDKSDRGAE
jgi:hypothetical protein